MRRRSLFLLAIFVTATIPIVVSVPETVSAYTPHAAIYINGDENFTAANGVIGGSGTSTNPYIIQGWDINITTTDGIYLYRTTAHFIIRNVYIHSATSSGSGIHFFDVGNGMVENVKVVGTWRGIYASFFGTATITGSVFSNTTTGIYLEEAPSSIINNKISNNVDGIFLGQYSWSTIIGNEISHNVNGLISQTGGIDVYSNSFVQNTNQASDTYGPFNHWDAGYPVGGNYWSDYTGADLYGGVNQNEPGADGIGDTPYVIDTDSVDRYPMMSLANTQPVAVISLAPSPPDPPPLEIWVDASASSDLEDPIDALIVHWDWENDGIWDTSWSTTKISHHEYPSPGFYTICLEVRDTGGLVGKACRQIHFSDVSPPGILHSPPSAARVNVTVTITAIVTDDAGVKDVHLHYKAIGVSSFTSVRMTRTSGDTYEATITAQSEPGIVYYHINATDDAGNEARHPQTGEHSFRVTGKDGPLPVDIIFVISIVAMIVAIIIIETILLIIMKKKAKGGEAAAKTKEKD